MEVMVKTGTIVRALTRFLLVVLIGMMFRFAARAGDDDSLRLGQNVQPLSEEVSLTVNPKKDSYTGSVKIELDVVVPLRSFRFHAEGMKLKNIFLSQGSQRNKLAYRSLETGLVEVTAAKNIAAGRYQLTVDFTNAFNTQAVGLYKVKSDDSSYVFTQFEPWDARKAFPCWDEPAFKIPYSLKVTVPTKDLAVSNTPIDSREVSGGQVKIAFRKTPPLPSYLIALAVGPFDIVPIPNLSIPGRILTVHGMAKNARVVASVASPILKSLEEYFGMSYPFEKLDLIAVPEYQFGAMENPGAVTFLDNIILMDSATAGASEKGNLAYFCAHELAHMWFGDMVTMQWWDDIWLNESFASWLGDKVSERVFPEYRADIQQVRSTQTAMAEDAQLSTHAMRRHVSPKDNGELLFDNLAYNKGESLLRMAEEYVGPDDFRKGILKYINAHKWMNTTAADLFNAIGSLSGKDLTGILSSFLDQPGVPIVSMALNDNGEVRLHQERFILSNETDSVHRIWKIPVMLRYGAADSSFRKTILLATDSVVVPLGSPSPIEWIVPNANSSGYFRYSLSPVMLQSVAGKARTLMNERERIEFLGNIRQLNLSGRVSAVNYLGAVENFKTDFQPEVSSRYISATLGMWYSYFAGNDSLRSLAFAFMDSSLRPAINHFGLARKEGEAETISLFRPLLLHFWGAVIGDTTIRRYADSLASGYGRGTISLEPSIASTVLAISAHQGDSLLFATYMDKFLKASTLDHPIYLGALGYFQQPAIVSALLEYVLHGPLRPQEILTIPFTIRSASPSYSDRIFEWSIHNYDSLRLRLTPDQVASLPFFATNVSAQNLEVAQNFFSQKEHDTPGTAENLAKVVENYRLIEKTRRTQLPQIVEYLRKRYHEQ